MPYKITFEQAEEIRAWFKEQLPATLAAGRSLKVLREQICESYGLGIRTVDNILAGQSHKAPRPVNKRKRATDS